MADFELMQIRTSARSVELVLNAYGFAKELEIETAIREAENGFPPFHRNRRRRGHDLQPGFRHHGGLGSLLFDTGLGERQ
ncbi:hypothetical protein HFO05_24565 [Rhizobium laguerreae]|uniref:hypothetical protein n=1 Tax=Rhizobium laguerreae TaxID=1076926 RepID=UPI001C8FE2C3|nr:hypothetical protein [Rhizobium laguerreae]MBY3271718.1 hypothetical protein [Rhizobium laguerreae]